MKRLLVADLFCGAGGTSTGARRALEAAGIGFSDEETSYEFAGNKTEVTKQIGNAVPVNTAAALVSAIVAA